jgi:hypothetical protein
VRALFDTLYPDVLPGMPSLLVQREVPTYGHCVFTAPELGKAFSDLVGWVQLGIKPKP